MNPLVWLLRLFFTLTVNISYAIGYVACLLLYVIVAAVFMQFMEELMRAFIKYVGPFLLGGLVVSVILAAAAVVVAVSIVTAPIVFGVIIVANLVNSLAYLGQLAVSFFVPAVVRPTPLSLSGLWSQCSSVANFFKVLFTFQRGQEDNFPDDCPHLRDLPKKHPAARPTLLSGEELTKIEMLSKDKGHENLAQSLGNYQQMLSVLEKEESLMMVPFEKPVLLIKEYRDRETNAWQSAPSLLWKCEYEVLKNHQNKNPYTNEFLTNPDAHHNQSSRYCLFAPKPASNESKALTTDEFNQLLVSLRSNIS